MDEHPTTSTNASSAITDERPRESLETRCCIVGGGPAGVMLSLLPARAGVPVTLLEAHKDFDRDFRGDTIHSSTLEVLDQMGLADRLHELPTPRFVSFASSRRPEFIQSRSSTGALIAVCKLLEIFGVLFRTFASISTDTLREVSNVAHLMPRSVADCITAHGFGQLKITSETLTERRLIKMKDTKNTKDTNDDCSGGWSHARSGDSKVWPMYPDGNSTYWYYAIRRDEDDTTGLRFEGEFAHARFQSFTVYNEENGKIIAAMRDGEIEADTGSQNPYLLNVARNTTPRSYTVAVVPEGSAVEGLSNVLKFPKGMKSISIWLRVYLPDENLPKENAHSGGVPLPSIHAFNAETGEPAPCPQDGSIKISLPDNLPPANADGKALFYRVPLGNLYPNKHNTYLASLFESVNETVAVVRFKPPTFPDTFSHEHDNDEHCVISKETQVRYWSLNVGGAKVANTTACLADYEALVAADGYVYTVFGRQRTAVEEKADALGYNFLGWGGHTDAVVIYRQLVAASGFAGRTEKVKPYADTQNQSIFEYAPIGLFYNSVDEFLANYDESSFDSPARA